jgi:hypothetical protein
VAEVASRSGEFWLCSGLQRGFNGARILAWSFLEGNELRYVTALEIPPVESPQTAVRAAIVSKAQK